MHHTTVDMAAQRLAIAAGRPKRRKPAAANASGTDGLGRRLGAFALGTLLGGVAAAAAADQPVPTRCGPMCQQAARMREPGRDARPGPPAIPAPSTATSPLALRAIPAWARPASTFIVTTPDDTVDPGDGRLSLREAVSAANADPVLDAIRFAPPLASQRLVLTGGQLVVSQDLIVDGSGGAVSGQVTVDAGRASRVLTIMGGETDVKLDRLVIAGGRSFGEPGGGIFLGGRASLMLADCAVTSNDTSCDQGCGYADGGGIFADTGAQLTLERTTVTGNSGRYYLRGGAGGGIAAASRNQVTIRNSIIAGNSAHNGGGISFGDDGVLTIENSLIMDNGGGSFRGAGSGGIAFGGGTLTISGSTIARNSASYFGGGINAGGQVTITDSTIASNSTIDRYGFGFGGGINFSGVLVVRNSTITGNLAGKYVGSGGGIWMSKDDPGRLDISNSIVAGNFAKEFAEEVSDISGPVTVSNGRNVFGSAVAGSVPGDRANVAPAALFASIDATTGGGRLRADGTVALKNSRANPALSAGDPLAATIFDQRGAARPQPAGSLPDLGAVELDQPLSTGASANNDVVSGSAAANSLSGRAGNDYLKGLAGNDTMDGGPGGDLLDGGPGNDKLAGGPGPDLVAYPGAAAVIIDLGGTTDTARRGGEKDTLIGIEGALGSSGADRFTGDALANEFQGKAGKDTMTGGGGRDSWDFNDTADSPAGAMRDLVTDFAPGQDVIDLAGVDADATVPGNQGFRWVAKATLTGAAQLGWFATGGMTIVRASTDADAAPELEIQLTGSKTLSEGDFRP